MNHELMYILWNPDLVAFHVGPLQVRWYSLCWLIGLALAYMVVQWLFKDQGIMTRNVQSKDPKTGRMRHEELNVFEPLFIYCFLGILIGARLGHCLFYQPDYYLTSAKGFMEMLLPIHITADGSWHFTGYEGLASHGGTLGLIIALWLYVRWSKLSLWQVLDNIAIATGITAFFIRIGNLMNSEIIGRATDVPWAFVFELVDKLPRHPGQLYEALCYLLLFVIMLCLYSRERSRDCSRGCRSAYPGTSFRCPWSSDTAARRRNRQCRRTPAPAPDAGTAGCWAPWRPLFWRTPAP